MYFVSLDFESIVRRVSCMGRILVTYSSGERVSKNSSSIKVILLALKSRNMPSPELKRITQ